LFFTATRGASSNLVTFYVASFDGAHYPEFVFALLAVFRGPRCGHTEFCYVTQDVSKRKSNVSKR